MAAAPSPRCARASAWRLILSHMPSGSGVSGHVILREGVRSNVFHLKYRLPDGRQVKRRLGPEWRESGRPPHGYYTKKTAEAALREILADAQRGWLPGQIRTGATFGDAVREWLRYVEHDRQRSEEHTS